MPGSISTVLVVEDDPIIRMNTVDVIGGAGFDVIEASNADAAIQILQAHPEIRLVFTDIEMPGTMDGLKLAHYIRGRWPKVYLMVASGKVRVGENQLPAGSKFFTKPYSDDHIVSEIKALLSEV